MSVEASAWARGAPVKGSAKAVLMLLASRHNHQTGQCNPSLATIAADAGLSRQTVVSALTKLAAAGLIAWTKAAGARGHRAPNRYELRVSEGVGQPARVQSPKSNPHQVQSPMARLEGKEGREEKTSAPEARTSQVERHASDDDGAVLDFGDDDEGEGMACLPVEIVAAQPRRAFVAPAPRHPTPAQIDAALAGAWRAFEAADDPRCEEAWA